MSAAEWKAKGNAALAAKDYDAAVAAYTEVGWRHGPRRACCDRESGPPAGTRVACCDPRPRRSQAIKADPGDHIFYSNRSAAHLSKGDAEAALEDADKCIELNAGFAKGFGRRGAALYALHEFSDAIVAYEQGLKVDASNAALKEGLEEAKAGRDRFEARAAG
jgi:stress-induced-phosphoprotein 1